MLMVGLTGGIGSGKSTVARMLEDEGAYVIDFDYLARLVVEPGKPAWREIADYFGPEILLPDRSLNRSALAEIVFSDARRLKTLEGFIHPRIFEARDALILAIKKKDSVSVVVIDFPLLFELGFSVEFDKTVLAYVPRDVQLDRATKRGGLTKKEVEKRLGAQMPIEEKRLLSDYVIDNRGGLNETRGQVRKTFRELQALSGMKESGQR